MANKTHEFSDEQIDEQLESLRGPFKYLEIEFARKPMLITLIRNDFDDVEFEVRTEDGRRREPLSPGFTYAVCQSMSRRFLRRKNKSERAMVRACRKAMSTIRAYEDYRNARAWYENLVYEIKVMFTAYTRFVESRDIHGISVSTARKLVRRLKRKKREQAKRNP